MKTIAPQERLNSILVRQINATRTLLNMLVEENSALTDENFEAIKQISASKHQEIIKLATLDKELDTLLQASACLSNKEGIESYIKRLDTGNSSHSKKSLNELRSLGEKCQRQNNINGHIINASYHVTQRVLSILHGIQPENSAQYGPGGRTTTNIPSRNLAKA